MLVLSKAERLDCGSSVNERNAELDVKPNNLSVNR